MRIAQVSPLYESVPPQKYGGTERVVSYLTEELVRLGHDVTLFASGDSRTSARLVPICDHSLRLDSDIRDTLAHHFIEIEEVFRRRRQFDVVHFHIDYLHFPLSRHRQLTQLTTLHGRLDLPELDALYAEFSDMPLVSISDAQRQPLRHARWLGTVYHGLPIDLYPFHETVGEYFAFLGRISPEKGFPDALEIAQRSGVPLRAAAKVDEADRSYFESTVAPLLCNANVEFVGEIGEADKAEFLGNAKALLMPIVWPEPFGLVLIESLACGTPVIAYRRGSIPELLQHGRNGFIVGNVDEAVEAAVRLSEISREDCRASFEQSFTSTRMAADYVALYDQLLEGDDDEQDHAVIAAAR